MGGAYAKSTAGDSDGFCSLFWPTNTAPSDQSTTARGQGTAEEDSDDGIESCVWLHSLKVESESGGANSHRRPKRVGGKPTGPGAALDATTVF